MKKLTEWFDNKYPTEEDKYNFFSHSTFIFGILSILGYMILFR